MYSVALLLSVELLNWALKRPRFQAATSHSSLSLDDFFNQSLPPEHHFQ
jgi:hypothetical protein